MSEFKGTPGPWEFDGNAAIITKDKGIVIGDFFGKVIPTSDNPDWLLIAAAPELLEALQQSLPHLREQAKQDGHAFGTLQLVNRIIAKALGDTK